MDWGSVNSINQNVHARKHTLLNYEPAFLQHLYKKKRYFNPVSMFPHQSYSFRGIKIKAACVDKQRNQLFVWHANM